MSIELLRSAVLEAHHTGGDRKVSIKLLRYAVLWEKMWRDRKVSIELLRSAVIGSVHRTAEVRSSIHTKNVSIKLPRSAVLWTLWKTATGGRCSQVHSALTVHRTRQAKTPLYLSQKLSYGHPFHTRLEASGGIHFTGNHGSLVQKSFLIRAAVDYNSIPSKIRSSSLPTFKRQLKQWVKTNIPLD